MHCRLSGDDVRCINGPVSAIIVIVIGDDLRHAAPAWRRADGTDVRVHADARYGGDQRQSFIITHHQPCVTLMLFVEQYGSGRAA